MLVLQSKPGVMTRPTLERVTDFSDYTCGSELHEFLKQTNTNNRGTNNLSDVRLSPDGRHIHVILRQPKVGLLTFDKYETPQIIPNQKRLDLRLTRTSSIVDIIYLDHNNNRNADIATLVVVYENGKAEFWKFQECKAGWQLLQTSDLCNSPRARVVSVSSCANLIIWCEERPHSESSPSISATRNNFRYCICKRAYEVEEGGVILGGVKIALHNNPSFTVITSGDHVYLLPAALQEKPLLSVSRCLLSWSPQRDAFRVCSTCKGALLLKKDSSSSPKETDFKRLVMDCLGYLSSLHPPEIHGFSPAACGGLLLLLSTGWVTLLQRDGALRPVYRPPPRPPTPPHSSLQAYGDTLALAAGRTLYLVELRCGRELQRIPLKGDGLLYAHRADRRAPRLLLETGLYLVARRPEEGEAEGGGRLVEAVFEEACTYYQRRSLSSTQLTVDKLKKAGMFQAPISLATILKDYLRDGGGLKAGAGRSDGGPPPGAGGQDKLLGSLEAELKALVSLEEVKGALVQAGEEEVGAVCQSLVHQEVGRLLTAAELEGQALLYLNALFSRFPPEAWAALQAALQLQCNGSGALSSRAPPEVWKTVLAPAHLPGPPADPASLTGSQPENRHPLKAAAGPPAPGPPLAVFELLCRTVLRFRAGWLPGLLELAHLKQGVGGLGVGLASSWSSAPGRGGAESGEAAVPLYKRALSVLHSQGPGADPHQSQDLEVELLLVSGRPNAVLQALRNLTRRGQWARAAQVAQRFCQQSPLLNKEIFASLLCEVAQHRDLDPYLDLLWALCPEDLTVTSILNLVLKNVPAPNAPPLPSCSPLSPSCSPLSPSCSGLPSPFPPPHSTELTVGLLKPLLRKVLQRETKPRQRYADILQSPVFPPAAPPRQPAETQPSGQRNGGPQPRATAPGAPHTDPPQWGSDPTAVPTPRPLERDPLGCKGGLPLPASPYRRAASGVRLEE
ncbi:BLOC-2 complex member HPS6 [Gadus macrocephalus]|uniref:BLOC-2 complex member HPS6 n=1 Tax=Gadus macrocephalus TaxID=80720 RepID=UPI0028CB1EAB|nr:BLOC-2 complex member HPS6 [Gadus macrocephalus]